MNPMHDMMHPIIHYKDNNQVLLYSADVPYHARKGRRMSGVTYIQQTLLMPLSNDNRTRNIRNGPRRRYPGGRSSDSRRDTQEINAVIAFFE